jgi:hypothetical protein
MSTLSVTTVTTGLSTTDLTLNTANTGAGDILIQSNGLGVTLSGNSTTNTAVFSPNGHVVFANATVNNFVMTSAGNFGILTSSPYGTVTVGQGVQPAGSSPSSKPNIEIWQGSTAVNDPGGIDLRGSSAGLGYGWRMTALDSTGVHLAFANRNNSTTYTEQMRLYGSGNVSIVSNNLTLGTSSSAANGYTYLPNGIKMVWGMVAAANTAAGTTATFASAFTAAPWVVQLTHQGNARTVAPLLVSSIAASCNISSGLATTSGTNVYFTAIGV